MQIAITPNTQHSSGPKTAPPFIHPYLCNNSNSNPTRHTININSGLIHSSLHTHLPDLVPCAYSYPSPHSPYSPSYLYITPSHNIHSTVKKDIASHMLSYSHFHRFSLMSLTERGMNECLYLLCLHRETLYLLPEFNSVYSECRGWELSDRIV